MTTKPNIREAKLYEKLEDDKVRCNLCERKCIIPNGGRGFCKTRENRNGKLYTLVYGDISSISANPIEKKPFFHFYPGSYALTVGTWSCNFTCPWCQNWTISKIEPKPEKANYISPEKLVDMTLRYKCQGTSISFNEPTLLFEYSLDVFREAKKHGLYNNYVSNGYMSAEALKMLCEAGMDAIKFDVKGDAEVVRRFCNANVEIIWRNIKLAKKLDLHVEIVNLVIPGVNDEEETIRWIAQQTLKYADEETPLHFTRYYPEYQFETPPTPVETLEKAYRIAKEEGLKYVYIGNVLGHKFENTYCPECGELLIKRYGFDIVKYKVKEDKKCPKCGEKIPIVGCYVKKSPLRFLYSL